MKYKSGDEVRPVRGTRHTIQADPRYIGRVMVVVKHEGYVRGMPYYELTDGYGNVDYADECNLERI